MSATFMADCLMGNCYSMNLYLLCMGPAWLSLFNCWATTLPMSVHGPVWWSWVCLSFMCCLLFLPVQWPGGARRWLHLKPGSQLCGGSDQGSSTWLFAVTASGSLARVHMLLCSVIQNASIQIHWRMYSTSNVTCIVRPSRNVRHKGVR